jgi:uncharacterized RDD family membrane protein YckC
MVWVATFWQRALALGIDLLLVLGLLAGMAGLTAVVLDLDGPTMLQTLAGGFGHLVVFVALFVLLLLIYLSVFARTGGQTLGKMLLGIRVVRLDGHSLSSLQAVRRALGMLLAGLPGMSGLLWVAFDLNRRGWHDRVAGTMVIRLRPPRSIVSQVSPAAPASQEG